MKTWRIARAVQLALVLFGLVACGGGSVGPTEEMEAHELQDTSHGVGLPPTSSKYVRLEGKWVPSRTGGNQAEHNATRRALESFFNACNMVRESRGVDRQPSLSADVLDVIGTFVEENWYDAQTGAARRHTYLTTVDLTDVGPAFVENRAPDCLAHRVNVSEDVQIWRHDGPYKYLFEDVGNHKRLTRRRMTDPDDLAWRRLPTNLALRERHNIAGSYCRDNVPVRISVGVIHACVMEPDADIRFRNLSMSLRYVLDTGIDQLDLTATYSTVDRIGFGRFAFAPVDELPVLRPEDEYVEVPDDPVPEEKAVPRH